MEGAICSLFIARRVIALVRKSGLFFAALYLKQCSVHLQQYYAFSSELAGQPAVRVSLSRDGLPRIIPKHHRSLIKKRGDRGHFLVRLSLSWFSVCRVVMLAKRVSKATFDSITTPQRLKGIQQILNGEFKTAFKKLQPMYLPWISSIALLKGISWKATWKSTPNDDRRFWKKPKPSPSILTSLKYEMASFLMYSRVLSSKMDFLHPGMMWSRRVLYPLDFSYTTRAMWDSLDQFHYYTDHILQESFKPLWLLDCLPGRLTCTLAGAGKRRMFAIGNFVRQRLLYPVHDWAMRVLSRIPTDGTFHQERPIHRLRRYDPAHVLSIDFKSATDRWPCSTIETLLTLFFGKTMASCVVRGCLQMNFFQIHRPLLNKARTLSFTAGQPLGYYGSWALFSLSHHYLVWFAAHLVYPRSHTPFRQYALLGDDIVIADRAVAEKYVELLYFLDVQISFEKSLDSRNGSLEFAKQFWADRVQVNLTPVSASAILASTSFIGLCQLACLSNNCLMTLAGMGYRVRARQLSTKSLSKRWRRLRVVADKSLSYSSLPLDLWLGRGLPLNPYKKGIIVERALSRFKPKQLVLPPEESLWYSEESAFLEETLYHDWIKEWLRWVQWHCELSSEYDPSLEVLFNPPIVPHTYKRNVPNQNEMKYGFLWTDLAGEDINVGILASTSALETEGTDSNREISDDLCGGSGLQPDTPQA
ncbi:hypothetical protein ZIOFF_074318 (mitochondrion) [Zingiber officinale]|uniref:RNA-dependent RNA polymerase n=1 Tax=Zingiber officinale TaxID=94328 RepID=A0A8J5ET91_ZINOF|nr:hypothetical protein ZIOFF_074318 [Zingiber officinale]